MTVALSCMRHGVGRQWLNTLGGYGTDATPDVSFPLCTLPPVDFLLYLSRVTCGYFKCNFVNVGKLLPVMS